MSEQKPLTARQFVAAGGAVCPRCESGDVSLSEPRMEGQSMFEDGECQTCGCEFYTVNRLVGYGLQGGSFVDGQDNVYTIAEDFGEITAEEPAVEIKPVGLPVADSTPASPVSLSCFVDGANHVHTRPIETENALTTLLKYIREAIVATEHDQMPRRVGVEIIHNREALGAALVRRSFLLGEVVMSVDKLG